VRFKRVSCSRYFAADTQARSEVVTPISVELHDFIGSTQKSQEKLKLFLTKTRSLKAFKVGMSVFKQRALLQ